MLSAVCACTHRRSWHTPELQLDTLHTECCMDPRPNRVCVGEGCGGGGVCVLPPWMKESDQVMLGKVGLLKYTFMKHHHQEYMLNFPSRKLVFD